MIKYRKNCTVCSAIKEDAKIASAIYKTQPYNPGSRVTLPEFHKGYEDKFSLEALRNHCKKHQALSADDMTERHMRNIARQAERELFKKRVESRDVWNTVMEMGYEDLKQGNMKLKVGDMLRAAKDQADFDFKAKDQEIAMIEMVYHFTSGSNQGSNTQRSQGGQVIDADDGNTTRDAVEAETISDHHTTEGSTDHLDEESDGSSGVYYPPAWDASTFGAS